MSERGAEAADGAEAWIAHMRRGDLAAAWAVNDAVLARRAGASCAHLPRHEQWVWRGESFAGRRVLVRCYHGLGDTIHFARCCAALRAIAADVTLWAQPALVPLLRTLRGVDRVLPLHDGAPDVAYDVTVEVMELPFALRWTLGDVARDVPYLHADAAARADGERLAIGLVWQAGEWDPRRSIPLALLAPLASIPGVALHALQRGPALADWHASLGPVSGSDDVCATARAMRALDLVISVDSMPAHLAGALGVPIWTLLQADADWRWMTAREDSPWYPTMRLFRQRAAGDWADVAARVVGEVEARAQAHAREHAALSRRHRCPADTRAC